MWNYKYGRQRGGCTQQLSQMGLPSIGKPFCKETHQAKQNEVPKLSKIRSGRLPVFYPPNSRLPESSTRSHVQEGTESKINVYTTLPQNIELEIKTILEKNQPFNQDYYNSQSDNFQANIQKHKHFLKIQREERQQSIVSKNTSKEHLENNGRQGQRPARGKRKEMNVNKRYSSRPKLDIDSPRIGTKPEHIASLSELSKLDRGDKVIIGQKEPLAGKEPPLAKEDIIEKMVQHAQSKLTSGNRLQKKMHKIKQKLSKRKAETKLYTEGDYEQLRNQNLFNSIHHYLSDPHRLSLAQKPHSNYPQLSQRKQVLEYKLKSIEDRLASPPRPPRTSRLVEANPRPADSGKGIAQGLQWRRIQLVGSGANSGKVLSVGESTFERQVNHLGSLQQRNQHSLQRYLQHQRMLHDLRLVKSGSLKGNLKRQFLGK